LAWTTVKESWTNAAADAEDDAVAVDLGRGSVFVDSVEEGTNDRKDAAEKGTRACSRVSCS
jgi:hypothetical protein